MTNNFTVTEIIDPTSGNIERVYKYKKKPCRRLLLDSKLCRQLAGYTLIEKDLRNVLTWLHEIETRHNEGPARNDQNVHKPINRENYDLIKGLFVAALTFYGKCFSKCEGRPVKLERAQLDVKFHEIHDNCISYRHNFAAHSGAERLEHVQIALVFPVRFKNNVPFNLYRELNQPYLLWHTSEEIALADLVEHARSIAVSKIDLLSEKIKREEILPNANKYWRTKLGP
ncbi:hypothetical protein [Methylomonas rosea]|uniref:Uncharacterized protein n=1 Tax=Methylomonas rosea TaxID=2952227 RepID=A0ABT1TW67_9GAMM|nr:hypothetical protein [Methylomonas sp. WSC-7]MCQ8119022.1 hypothetical protein [Methylomonas sp. WSC-7]